MQAESDLGRALQETRDALLAGDLTGLSALAARLEAASMPADAAELAGLHRLATGNATLIAAAMRGVGAARHRLRDIAQGASPRTYDAEGRMGHIPVAGLPLRRA